jgi:sigma-B regulation protein RsbU (phosphoserine phosphatase)
MYKSLEVLLVTGGYFSILFFAAYYAEHRERKGTSIVANPYIYSLSLAVYCTSWTFYGSVGKAAVSGLSFLTIYLGPTLAAALWWIVLRKILTIAKEHRITTIADFIGSRYGNSILLAGIVTVVAAIGITPYLGLQLKAIVRTFSIVSGSGTDNMAAGFVLTLVIALFADIFCVRRHEISEKHDSIVMAIAIESLVKLGAFIALGVYVTWFLFDGFGDILRQAREANLDNLLTLGAPGSVGYVEWTSLIMLSMTAFMFLPRQFHVAVVENYDIDHLSKAVWLFPLYLLLINIFVLPVALGGLLLGEGVGMADTFGLTIPLDQGARSLALFVFLGGFSAASGMIIVESMAISNMVMNSIVNPALWRFNKMKGFSFLILNIKRLIIMGSVLAGYLFAVTVGTSFSLVDLGLISFVAVTIFAPSILFGLYWKRGNRNGALAGTVGGFLVWCYTLIFPAFVTAGIIDNSGLVAGLLSSDFLNPSALFGVKGLDRWSNALFWGLLVNTGFYVLFSLLTSQDEEEERTALAFVDNQPVQSRGGGPEKAPGRGEADPLGHPGDLHCEARPR